MVEASQSGAVVIGDEGEEVGIAFGVVEKAVVGIAGRKPMVRRPAPAGDAIAAQSTPVSSFLFTHGGPSPARASSTQLATAAPHRANVPRQNTFARKTRTGRIAVNHPNDS
jgi:hypothetical protein